jgi:hypothetical protein
MNLTTEQLNIQRSRANPTKHENLLFTYCNAERASLGYGDVGILHNIAICLKMKKIPEEKLQKQIDRIHITVRTMRRSTHWDWVKPDHLIGILSLLHELYENTDEFVGMYKDGQHFLMGHYEQAVEAGRITEGDYLEVMNGLKKPYEFITGGEFKDWLRGRSEFYLTLNGAMPKIELTQLAHLNEHDGKMLLIKA